MIQRRDSSPKALSAKWRKLLMRIPGYDPFATAGDCWFDVDAAQLAMDFFPECIKHVKGRQFAGKPFVLAEWQEPIVANTFGWKRPDNTRRYRIVGIWVPKKNGKTTFGAALCNYVLFCDGEPGAECYSAAAEKEQARLAFEIAVLQVEAEPALRKRATIYRNSIVIKGEASSYKPLSAEAFSKHGYNVHFVLSDELHAQPNRELIDVLETGMAARSQPLMIHITTADFAGDSICNEVHAYAIQVRDGIIEDDSFLPVLYEALPDDDWTDPKIWAKANPNLGVSVTEDYLRRKCEKAKTSPSFENTFRRLHLNVCTEQDVRWLPMDKWDACDGDLDLDKLLGQPCYAGLDLASTIDIAAFVLIFPEANNAVLPFFWIPAETAPIRERRDRVPYATWARQGLIETTDGNVIDYDVIRRQINEIGEKYNIVDIAVDRWNAQQIITQLDGDGFNVVPFGQGYKSMTAPSKELERLVLSCNLRHGGNPVLRWMASNVSAEIDAAGNIKPSKKKSKEKIDGIVGLVMAIGRTLLSEGAEESVYETRGVRSV